jgi:hypothetical protein
LQIIGLKGLDEQPLNNTEEESKRISTDEIRAQIDAKKIERHV